MTRVLVCSIPKAGTYLSGKVLENIGFRDSQWHLSETRYQDYGAISLAEGRKYPKKVTRNIPFYEMVASLPEQTFAVSHLSPELVLPLMNESSDLKVIFLKRNLLDVFVSFNHWHRSTGRWSPRASIPFLKSKPRELRAFFKAHPAAFENIRSSSGWSDMENCITLSFEALTGLEGEEAQTACIDSLLSGLQCDSTMSASEVIRSALASDTLTKSDRDRDVRDCYYDLKNMKILRDKGMLKINASLGYSSRIPGIDEVT